LLTRTTEARDNRRGNGGLRRAVPGAHGAPANAHRPRQIPIKGEPADVTTIVENYAAWLSRSEILKVLIAGDPIAGWARPAARAIICW
jgi:hypothetical protein